MKRILILTFFCYILFVASCFKLVPQTTKNDPPLEIYSSVCVNLQKMWIVVQDDDADNDSGEMNFKGFKPSGESTDSIRMSAFQSGDIIRVDRNADPENILPDRCLSEKFPTWLVDVNRNTGMCVQELPESIEKILNSDSCNWVDEKENDRPNN